MLWVFSLAARRLPVIARHAIMNSNNVASILFMSPWLWQRSVFSSEDFTKFLVESFGTHQPKSTAYCLPHTLIWMLLTPVLTSSAVLCNPINQEQSVIAERVYPLGKALCESLSLYLAIGSTKALSTRRLTRSLFIHFQVSVHIPTQKLVHTGSFREFSLPTFTWQRKRTKSSPLCLF